MALTRETLTRIPKEVFPKFIWTRCIWIVQLVDYLGLSSGLKPLFLQFLTLQAESGPEIALKEKDPTYSMWFLLLKSNTHSTGGSHRNTKTWSPLTQVKSAIQSHPSMNATNRLADAFAGTSVWSDFSFCPTLLHLFLLILTPLLTKFPFWGN